MKPTGWFQVAWSAEIAPGGVQPLRYFGQDLVAFRSHRGELAVLDAHCRHLGAHLGHDSVVVDGCVQCPYHGWQWGPDGSNTVIPYQDEPSKARLRSWPVVEQHGVVFLWHDPAGGPPRDGWEVPDLFALVPEIGPASEADYFPTYPHAVVDKPDEPVHPQLIQENTCDSMHFRYTHGAPLDPTFLGFETEGPRWASSIGFTSPRTGDIALRVYNILAGVGISLAVFDGGKTHHRLILTGTPIDDSTTHLRVSYFLPRLPHSPDLMTAEQLAFAVGTEATFEQDARIWRHQVFVQKPVFARQDIEGYTALRKYCQQFYELDDQASPTPVLEG
jgi:phenylpropionate dioxygenase-like ring-hydroxylating dioxygenase large terminal subunit